MYGVPHGRTDHHRHPGPVHPHSGPPRRRAAATDTGSPRGCWPTWDQIAPPGRRCPLRHSRRQRRPPATGTETTGDPHRVAGPRRSSRPPRHTRMPTATRPPRHDPWPYRRMIDSIMLTDPPDAPRSAMPPGFGATADLGPAGRHDGPPIPAATGAAADQIAAWPDLAGTSNSPVDLTSARLGHARRATTDVCCQSSAIVSKIRPGERRGRPALFRRPTQTTMPPSAVRAICQDRVMVTPVEGISSS